METYFTRRETEAQARGTEEASLATEHSSSRKACQRSHSEDRTDWDRGRPGGGEPHLLKLCEFSLTTPRRRSGQERVKIRGLGRKLFECRPEIW